MYLVVAKPSELIEIGLFSDEASEAKLFCKIKGNGIERCSIDAFGEALEQGLVALISPAAFRAVCESALDWGECEGVFVHPGGDGMPDRKVALDHLTDEGVSSTYLEALSDRIVAFSMGGKKRFYHLYPLKLLWRELSKSSRKSEDKMRPLPVWMEVYEDLKEVYGAFLEREELNGVERFSREVLLPIRRYLDEVWYYGLSKTRREQALEKLEALLGTDPYTGLRSFEPLLSYSNALREKIEKGEVELDSSKEPDEARNLKYCIHNYVSVPDSVAHELACFIDDCKSGDVAAIKSAAQRLLKDVQGAPDRLSRFCKSRMGQNAHYAANQLVRGLLEIKKGERIDLLDEIGSWDEFFFLDKIGKRSG